MEMYKAVIWGGSPDLMLEQVDAISLLWRMDMAGLPQENYWQDIAAHLGVHPYEQYVGFHNIHYVYALARAGQTEKAREAISVARNCEHHVDKQPCALWDEVCIPLMEAAVAYTDKNHIEVVRLIEPIQNDIFRVGGSDAQDELLVQMYFTSLVASGRAAEARQYFDKELSYYRGTALADYWFSEL